MSRFLHCAAVTLVLAAAVPAVGRGWKTPPDLEADHLPRLCERFDGAPNSKFRLPQPGAESWPVYRLVRDEVEFRVALDPDTHQVRAVSTKDPGFRTPEGVGLGSTLGEARQQSAGELRCPAGWNCFADLPSGWSLGFSVVHTDPETKQMEYRDPGDDSAVNSLVLRGSCEGGSH